MSGRGGGVTLVESRTVIDTWLGSWFTEALFKAGTRGALDGKVTAEDVVDVLAVAGSVGTVNAKTDAVVVGTHCRVSMERSRRTERSPFVTLPVLSAESVGEGQATFGVAETSPGVGLPSATSKNNSRLALLRRHPRGCSYR